MLRITGQNTISELSLVKTTKWNTSNRWEFQYRINRSYIEPPAMIDSSDKVAILYNTPEELDEFEVIVTPEGTEVEDFQALVTSYMELEAMALAKSVEHAENIGVFNLYVDDTDDLWEGETLPTGIVVKDWETDESVATGFLRKYNGVNYRCTLKHTTQVTWTPDVSNTLWAVAPTTGGGGYPLWVQPTGGHDAYALDAIVEHNTFNWKSKLNGNVWEPTVGNAALWEKLT